MRRYLPIFLTTLLFAFPFVARAEEAAEAVESAVFEAVVQRESPGDRITLLTDAAQAWMKQGRVESAVAAAGRIESERERKSLLRRLALLAADQSFRAIPLQLDTPIAWSGDDCETILRALIVLAPGQSVVAGEVAIRVLNGLPTTVDKLTVSTEVLRFVETFEKPFESDRRACDFVAALAKAGDLDAAMRYLDKITGAEAEPYKDWAKLAILEERSRRGEIDKALEIAAAFARPEKRSWALLTLARNEKHSRYVEICGHSYFPCPCHNPQVRIDLLKRVADAIDHEVAPEHACIQLRILADEVFRIHPFDRTQRELAEEGIALLQRAEARAWDIRSESLRFARLAAIARAYRLFVPERDLHGPLVCRIREAFEIAEKQTPPPLTPKERIRIWESLRQALGEPLDAKLVRAAAADPETVELLGEMLLRDAALQTEAQTLPDGDPASDRVRLPFDVYDNYYYSPFAVDDDCGC